MRRYKGEQPLNWFKNPNKPKIINTASKQSNFVKMFSIISSVLLSLASSAPASYGNNGSVLSANAGANLNIRPVVGILDYAVSQADAKAKVTVSVAQQAALDAQAKVQADAYKATNAAADVSADVKANVGQTVGAVVDAATNIKANVGLNAGVQTGSNNQGTYY